MHLVLTHYLSHSTDDIERRIGTAIPGALRAAAARIDAVATEPRGDIEPHRAVLRGVEVLEGAEVDWDDDAGLTTVRVRVPWSGTDDDRGQTLLAANRFAQVISDQTAA